MTRPGAGAWRTMHQDQSVVHKKLAPGTLRRVVSFARPYRKELAVFLLLTIISSVIGVATPLLAGDVINVISGGNGTVEAVLRLAVTIAGDVDIFPINYAVDHGTIVFRSAEGSKVTGALSGANVAFEVDSDDQRSGLASSVVIKGRAQAITSTAELLDTASLPLSPWHGSPKGRFIRITPHQISGRRFSRADPHTWDNAFGTSGHAATE